MNTLITAPNRREPAMQPFELGKSEDAPCAMHIREVVRNTGLRREQLWMWERRYNFPVPLRDAFGDRVYPPGQVARLKLIKQLLSEGWRAGAVVRLAESALRSMLGLAIEAPAPVPDEIREATDLLAEHRIDELQNRLSKLFSDSGLRHFLERTLIPLTEAVHDRVVRGEMQSFQASRLADVSLRLLRDATPVAKPSRHSRQILLVTPPNDPNPLGLAILELLLFTEGISCLTLGPGVPAQEVVAAARAYNVCVVALLFDRGMSTKIARQEIRALRAELPEKLPLLVTGRAVNMLATPIPDVHTAVDFSTVMTMMKNFGVASTTPGADRSMPSTIVLAGDAQPSPSKVVKQDACWWCGEALNHHNPDRTQLYAIEGVKQPFHKGVLKDCLNDYLRSKRHPGGRIDSGKLDVGNVEERGLAEQGSPG